MRRTRGASAEPTNPLFGAGKVVLSTFLLCLGGTEASFLQAQDSKEPIPDAAAQKSAEKLIRDLFKEEYTKKAPADKAGLATKLLTQSAQSGGDSVTRYVLLREAQDLASQAGDAPLTLKVIRQMESFQINAASLGYAALQSIGKGIRTSEDAKALAASFLNVFDLATEADDFETASKASEAALQLARKAKDLPLTSKCDAKVKEATALKATFDKVKKAKESLSRNAEDPQANLIVGTYVCTVKSDWSTGLPLLAKAEDGPFKTLAVLELSGPSEASTQLSLGDGWWDLSEKANGAARNILRQHAGVWYEKVLPMTTGLSKTRVGMRVLDIRMDRLGPKENWITVSASGHGAPAKEGEGALELIPKANTALVSDLNSLPSGEFDGISARIRFKDVQAHAGITLEAQEKIVFIDSGPKTFAVGHKSSGQWQNDFEKLCGDRSEYNVCVLVANGEYVMYLDGEESGRFKTQATRISQPGFHADTGPAIFDQVRLRRK